MLAGFFLHLKAFGLPVSTREFLTLLEALEQRVITTSLDDFHTLARACLVKDEQHFDRFDLAFGSYFKGVDALLDARAGVPDDRAIFQSVVHPCCWTDRNAAHIAAAGFLLSIRGASPEAPPHSPISSLDCVAHRDALRAWSSGKADVKHL